MQNFSSSSITFTQLSLAFRSSHIFLPGWPKFVAAFSGKTLQNSSGNSHASSTLNDALQIGSAMPHALFLFQSDHETQVWPAAWDLKQSD